MNKFFDYVYFRLCAYYQNMSFARKNFEMYACLAVSAAQGFNILTILLFIRIWFDPKREYAELFIIILFSALVVINAKRYNKVEFDDLQKKFGDDENYTVKGFFVIVYYIITFLLLICVPLMIKHFRATGNFIY